MDGAVECDPFDEIVLAEDRAYEEGYKEGFDDGSDKARKEGYSLGVTKGLSLGQEVGFYWGFLLSIREQCCTGGGSKKSSRALVEVNKLLAKMEALCSDNAAINPTNVAFFDEIEHVRTKFKQISSLMNIKASSGGSDPATSF